MRLASFPCVEFCGWQSQPRLEGEMTVCLAWTEAGERDGAAMQPLFQTGEGYSTRLNVD